MFSDFYHYYFQPIGQPWHHGAIWGNIFASIIVGVIAFIWARRKFIKVHKKMEEHHEALKKHITKEHEKSRKHIERVHNG